MQSTPKRVDAHTAEVVELLPALLTQRGALVLFASGLQMRRVYASIPEALREFVLMQGTLPKAKIIARHVQGVDAGGRSIVFGLAWQVSRRASTFPASCARPWSWSSWRFLFLIRRSKKRGANESSHKGDPHSLRSRFRKPAFVWHKASAG
jgi:hypothetical protein